ncbi:MAG: hypothetical protein P4M11_01235 [Candidatus Pacebacteria bacterium]|nr:hypothetical protein [Candidatus Paceibacterota bacterium]
MLAIKQIRVRHFGKILCLSSHDETSLYSKVDHPAFEALKKFRDSSSFVPAAIPIGPAIGEFRVRFSSEGDIILVDDQRAR